MKVKVGDKIYDGDKEPVMVILTDRDKQLIGDMPQNSCRYANFPNDYDSEKAKKWMAEDILKSNNVNTLEELEKKVNKEIKDEG